MLKLNSPSRPFLGGLITYLKAIIFTAQGRAGRRDLSGPDPVPYDPQNCHLDSLQRRPLLAVYLNMHYLGLVYQTDGLRSNIFLKIMPFLIIIII